MNTKNLLLFILVVITTGIKANEKINKAIRTSLGYIDGYEPIHTKIDSIFTTLSTDLEIGTSSHMISKLKNEMEIAKDSMNHYLYIMSLYVEDKSEFAITRFEWANNNFEKQKETFNSYEIALDEELVRYKYLIDNFVSHFAGINATHTFKCIDKYGQKQTKRYLIMFDAILNLISEPIDIDEYIKSNKIKPTNSNHPEVVITFPVTNVRISKDYSNAWAVKGSVKNNSNRLVKGAVKIKFINSKGDIIHSNQTTVNSGESFSSGQSATFEYFSRPETFDDVIDFDVEFYELE